MYAFIEEEFSKGFILSQENLIKLQDIILKRSVEISLNAQIVYGVYRIDGVYHETSDLNVILAEENSTRNAITRLDLKLDVDGHFLNIKFDKDNGIELSMHSTKKDFLYLLLSDIKDYLNSEVLIFWFYRYSKILSSSLTIPLSFLLSLIISIFIGIAKMPKLEKIDTILKSESTLEKLNFLIEIQRRKSDPSFLAEFILYPVVFCLVMLVSFFLINKLFPCNIFYWGKAETRHNKFLSTRDKFFWGVGVAFFVGIASAIAVNYF